MSIDLQIDEYKKIYNLLKYKIDKFNNKTFLITGASGLIGSYLTDFLTYLNKYYDANIQLYLLSRNKNHLIKRFNFDKNIVFIEQNLNEPLNFDCKADYIIHAASNAHPVAYANDPVGTMETNIFGTYNLLQLAKTNNSKMLYISSGEIYGSNLNNKYFTELDLGYIDTKDFRSCYPESKRAAETLCMAYCKQYNVRVNVARLCYIYGATVTDSNSRADAQFLRNATNKQNIVLKSKGSQQRTYCYVADAVSGLLFILLSGADNEFYNIANPNSIVSIAEYAETLANINGVSLKYDIPEESEKNGYSRAKNSILDSTKLINLGWQPEYTLENGLKHCCLIYKQLHGLA